ncbi:acyl-CoA dehydrogenase/oxidase [Mucor mucedo]|uniref:acyl-CoA dehydrogenase/oxidase n=1 Tax=Mucor mucedo TaxID=29922 RepID=UPI00221F85FD|nr:acyl-CoA dehydrogenase/oxidase [Mucor mucedo]KAI7889076.1 acyl-CoA dehydrogenase/oxidase [Mucor mucedo]
MAVQFPKHLKPIEPQGKALLQQERDKATFNSDSLKKYIYGNDYLEIRERILQILLADPLLSDKSHRYYNGRDIRFQKSLAAAKRLVELARIHKWNEEEVGMAEYLFDEPSAFRLHRSMFMPTIANQGTEEQKKLYLEPALKHEIIGCYAQTELGHGSNVRGLETTATYHLETQTFIINSPTLTSSKWWIGGLGVAANHAIVMARLITRGKDYGPHPFVVQIRNLENHEPLAGVVVGDIGPKFGFNTVDNGFILFDHMHVPHVALLARYSSVDKITGEYITPPNSKLAYGTMVYVRANIVLESRVVLARAATVAIRYSAVRSQGSDAANPKKLTGPDGTIKVVETPVLDYTMQQYRLFPIIAQAYACHFTGQEMHRMYHENQQKMSEGDFSYLADLHASSSGLKSLTTTLAVSAIEDCRRACGGHGYSLFSGLGQFYQDYLPKATWEGDNYLLTQQTARYLLKTMRSVQSGKTKDKNATFSIEYISEYLANPQAKSHFTTVADLSNPEALLSAFKFRAAFLIEKAVYAIDIEQTSWNDMLVEIYRISRAHCQLVMVSNFLAAVFNNNKPVDATLCQALQRVAILFCLSTLEQETSDFLTSGYIVPAQALMIKQHFISVLKSIRPDVVALVDAFGFPDYLLNSALGENEGDVYEKMTAMAEKEPLNQSVVAEGYQNYIRPLIHGGKANWKFDNDGIARL